MYILSPDEKWTHDRLILTYFFSWFVFDKMKTQKSCCYFPNKKGGVRVSCKSSFASSGGSTHDAAVAGQRQHDGNTFTSSEPTQPIHASSTTLNTTQDLRNSFSASNPTRPRPFFVCCCKRAGMERGRGVEGGHRVVCVVVNTNNNCICGCIGRSLQRERVG